MQNTKEDYRSFRKLQFLLKKLSLEVTLGIWIPYHIFYTNKRQYSQNHILKSAKNYFIAFCLCRKCDKEFNFLV